MGELKKEINDLFVLVRALEERQKSGDEVPKDEVQNLKSLTLTLDAIAESMIPEKD
jgi:hypothetical protein